MYKLYPFCRWGFLLVNLFNQELFILKFQLDFISVTFLLLNPSFISCIDFLVYFVYLYSLIHLVYCILLILLNILTVVLLNLSDIVSKSLWWNPLLWNCLGVFVWFWFSGVILPWLYVSHISAHWNLCTYGYFIG